MASLSTSSTQTRKALIIGNNYPNDTGELLSCANDMESVHRILKDKCHFHFSEEKPNLNYMDMQETISDFSDTLNDSDSATNHIVGETKSTDDSATAIARVCFQQLPRHLRLLIFHSLSYRNYLLVSPTCTMFQTDLALSLENNLVLRYLHVPEDYRTLNEGYKKVEQSKGAVTTIVLGQGDHVVEDTTNHPACNYLHIKCPVNIVGSPKVLDKSKIVVVGGFWITANGVHVEHLTIRHKKGCGVYGESSFTLNDLMIDQSGYSGVVATGSSTLSRCINIRISKCHESGVSASKGATIIMDGSDTLIDGNGNWIDFLRSTGFHYGLKVWDPSSKIQIVSPLTKESISKGNVGNRNWNVGVGRNFNAWDVEEYQATLNQIETIEE